VAGDAVIRAGRSAGRLVGGMGGGAPAGWALAGVPAIGFRLWLQIGNPFRQFIAAYTHFLALPMDFTFQSWGQEVATNDLPWYYLPSQFLARLPELFLLLLIGGALFAIATAVAFTARTLARVRARGAAGLAAPAFALARTRGTLVGMVASILPVTCLMIKHTTHYDGVGHVLFVIPMLAVLAAGALLKLVPLLRKWPLLAGAAAVAVAAHIGACVWVMARLHPLEYVAM